MDGVFNINPDKVITGRTFEYCHACGEEVTTSEDMPWCNEVCLQRLSDAWWEEYKAIHKDMEVKKEGEGNESGRVRARD